MRYARKIRVKVVRAFERIEEKGKKSNKMVDSGTTFAIDGQLFHGSGLVDRSCTIHPSPLSDPFVG